MRAILLAAILTSALPGTVAGQTLAQQWAWCRADDPEHLIGGCSAVIRAGREKPDILARAFAHRGRAWSDRGQFDRAIQDFDRAVRLDPQYADAFNDRGVAYVGKGDSARAIYDFDQAIRLDANYAIAIFNRGLALQNLGRAAEAAKAFAAAKEVGPRLKPPRD